MTTTREKLKAALEGRGWVVDHAHLTRKYVAMKRGDANWSTFPPETSDRARTERVFIGRMGALRHAIDGLATHSVQVPKMRANLLEGRPSLLADPWDISGPRIAAARERKLAKMAATVAAGAANVQ